VSMVAQAAPPAETPPRAVDRQILDGNVGYYERESQSDADPLVFTITREGDRLLLQRTGTFAQTSVALFPGSDREFTYVSVVGLPESTLRFVPGDQGQATGIVVREQGEDITARRVDAAEASRATELFNRRIANQRQPRVAVTIDPTLFDRYVGNYQLSSGQIINVEREGGQFFFRYRIPGRERIRLHPESETEYFAEAVPAQITFVIDPQGQVTGLISHQGGWNSPAKRVGDAEVRIAEAASSAQVRQGVERRAEERRPREAVAVDPSVSDRDTGIYDAGFSGTFGRLFTITRDGDQLFAQVSGQPKIPIFPEREHVYFFKGAPAQLTFMIDGPGSATRLILHYNGRDITARRIGDLPRPDQPPPPVDPGVFDRCVGWFQLNPVLSVAVSREGSHLFVQRGGQARFEVFPSTAGVYFSGDGRAWIAFEPEGSDRATEIILYDEAQMGAMRGTRMDDAKGREIQDAVTRRIAAAPDRFVAQKPAPGSEAAARSYIEIVQSGAVGGDLMSPRASDLLRRQQPFLRDQLTKLGNLQSLSFRGVALAGADIYDVKFTDGRAKLRINMRPDGKLDDANLQVESDGTPGGILACSQESTLRSRMSPWFPIMMTIVNRSGGDIMMFALSPAGDRYSTAMLPLAPMADGRSMPRMATASEPVVVTDGSDACLEIIMPGEATQTVVVRPPGALPRATAPQSVPLAGAEDALRQYIGGVRRGMPNYEQMTPWAADVARRQLRLHQAILAKLGSVQAVSFAGIGPGEDDIYQVKFDNGSAEWRIDLANDGKIRHIALGPE